MAKYLTNTNSQQIVTEALNYIPGEEVENSNLKSISELPPKAYWTKRFGHVSTFFYVKSPQKVLLKSKMTTSCTLLVNNGQFLQKFAHAVVLHDCKFSLTFKSAECYQQIFSGYKCFNIIQSTLYDFLMKEGSSVIVSAPTGSGKTALFELAIVRCLMENQRNENYKILYVAPVKALCSERIADWQRKFRHIGLNIVELTGDSDILVDIQTLQYYHLILTTPEKWDSITRKIIDSSFLQEIKLFLIDEVHLLNDEKRGPTLEAIVSRIKISQSSQSIIRFVAVSATIPNIEDIATWLGFKGIPAKFYKFGEETRPVKLNRIVIGYPCKHYMRGYKFDLNLTYQLKQLIVKHSQGKPTIVFCNSRKGVTYTCNVLNKDIVFNFSTEQKKKLIETSDYLLDNKLRDMVKHGIAYHHAGLALSDRNHIEELFRSGFLPLLVSTSTLAMGVNLPAHLVIIKSTEQYVSGQLVQYSEAQLMQMMGRAGRPQFDSSATVIIMTTEDKKEKYEKLAYGKEIVESSLHKCLAEFLNTEIVLGTVDDIPMAMLWLKTTYFFIRALKNPAFYGLPVGLTGKETESRLQEMCMRGIHALENARLVVTSCLGYNLEPTENGKVMAHNYITFETMRVFMRINGTENMKELLNIICDCQEFQDVQLRRSEKSTLNMLNAHKELPTIRFPIIGKIKNKQMKANCLIQAVLGALPISDTSLVIESTKVMRIAERVLKGLTQFLWQKNCFRSLMSALILFKCITCRLWENSPFLSRQLPGIGPALSSLLASAGRTSFQSILTSNPRDLERIINRAPPIGNELQEAVAKLPQYHINLSYQQNNKLTVNIGLKNADNVQYGNTLHKCSVLIADSKNNILKKEKICDQAILTKGGVLTLFVKTNDVVNEIIAVLISENIVGVDVKATLISNKKECIQSHCLMSDEEANSKEKITKKKNTKINKSRQQCIQPFMSSTNKKKTNSSPQKIVQQIEDSEGNDEFEFTDIDSLFDNPNNNEHDLPTKNDVISTYFDVKDDFDVTDDMISTEMLEFDQVNQNEPQKVEETEEIIEYEKQVNEIFGVSPKQIKQNIVSQTSTNFDNNNINKDHVSTDTNKEKFDFFIKTPQIFTNLNSDDINQNNRTQVATQKESDKINFNSLNLKQKNEKINGNNQQNPTYQTQLTVNNSLNISNEFSDQGSPDFYKEIEDKENHNNNETVTYARGKHSTPRRQLAPLNDFPGNVAKSNVSIGTSYELEPLLHIQHIQSEEAIKYINDSGKSSETESQNSLDDCFKSLGKDEDDLPNEMQTNYATRISTERVNNKDIQTTNYEPEEKIKPGLDYLTKRTLEHENMRSILFKNMARSSGLKISEF